MRPEQISDIQVLVADFFPARYRRTDFGFTVELRQIFVNKLPHPIGIEVPAQVEKPQVDGIVLLALTAVRARHIRIKNQRWQHFAIELQNNATMPAPPHGKAAFFGLQMPMPPIVMPTWQQNIFPAVAKAGHRMPMGAPVPAWVGATISDGMYTRSAAANRYTGRLPRYSSHTAAQTPYSHSYSYSGLDRLCGILLPAGCGRIPILDQYRI